MADDDGPIAGDPGGAALPVRRSSRFGIASPPSAKTGSTRRQRADAAKAAEYEDDDEDEYEHAGARAYAPLPSGE